MLTGYVRSDWHYQRPILDRILLWYAKGLRSPLLWLYNATGRSSHTLQRWESMLWSLAVRHTRIQKVVYFDITEGVEKSLSTSSLGSQRFTVGTTNLSPTSCLATKKRVRVRGLGTWNTQGRE